MTTTDKTTPETASTPDATSGRDRLMNAAKTTVGAMVASLGVSLVVAFAMGWDRDRYLRFVGFLAVVAFGAVVVKAYRTYVHPGRSPVVEETPPEEGEKAS